MQLHVGVQCLTLQEKEIRGVREKDFPMESQEAAWLR